MTRSTNVRGLPPTLFAMFVIMAIVATAPILQVLTPSVPGTARELASR